MNPFSWVRWKFLIVVAVLGFVTERFVMPRYLEGKIVADIESRMNTSARIDRLEFSLMQGTMRIEGLRIDDPLDRQNWLFTADSMDFELVMSSLFKRKLEAKRLELHSPRTRVTRRPGDEGESGPIWKDVDPSEVYEKAKEIYSGYEKARDWYGKIQRVLAEIRARQAVQGDVELMKRLYRRTPLPEVGPRFVLHRLAIDGIEVNLEGQDGLPKFRAGSLQALGINSSPQYFKDATTFALASRLDDDQGPAFRLQADLVSSVGGFLTTQFSGLLEKIDVKRLENLVGEHLPVSLLDGKMSLTWNGSIKDLANVDLRPVLVFENLKVRPKPGFAKVAGFASDLFSKELSLAGTFALTDIRIHGDLFAPEIDLGSTIPTLMKMGGKAFAESIGKQMAQELLGRISGQIPGGEALLGLPAGLIGGSGGVDLGGLLGQGGGADAGRDVLQGLLGAMAGEGKIDAKGAGMKEALPGLLGGALGGGGKEALDPGKLLDGLLGGSKKDQGDGKKPGGVDPKSLLDGILGGKKN